MTYKLIVHSPGMTADWTVEAPSDTNALEQARAIARAYVMPASLALYRPEWEEAAGLCITAPEADAPAWWSCEAGPFERFKGAK